MANQWAVTICLLFVSLLFGCSCAQELPLQMLLINNSPRIVGSSVSVDVNVSKPTQSLTCHLRQAGRGFSNRQDCSSQSIVYPNLNDGKYILRVVGRAVTGERAVIRTGFQIGAEHKIRRLPGVTGSVSFDMYSGFITVNETYMTKSFYWFVTADVENPEDAPLIICVFHLPTWKCDIKPRELAGGPGCSGMLAMFVEFGPFFPLRDLSLSRNQYSWNKVANILIVDSPIGVGFSYSEVPIDFVHNDVTTTRHNLQFLIKFFDRYPEFSNTAFWVTGSSYGGHYVPYLTEAIVEYNKQAPSRPINLQGFLAIAPITHSPDDSRGALDYWFFNGLISEATYSNIINTCDFTFLGPYLIRPNMVQSPECASHIRQAYADMGPIDPFNVPRGECVNEANIDPTSWIPRRPITDKFQDPCIPRYLRNYLRRDDVVQAFHAEDSPNGDWNGCRWPESVPFQPKGLNYSFEVTLYDSMLPVYQRLFEENLRILVYSGDGDAAVTHVGTERWIKSLNLTVVRPFRPWIAFDGQVAGYAVEYSELTYVLLAGGGHCPTQNKPHHGLELFSDFITGIF